jgi:hypothetical protein
MTSNWLLHLVGVDPEALVNKTSDEAQETINEAIKKVEPLLHELSNRIGAIAHGLLDRVQVHISIEIIPIGKAKLANPGIPDAPPK